MQPFAPKAPSKSETLIDELRHMAGHLINGDVEDGAVPVALLAAAADEIERLRAQEYRMAARIHQQRCALRENWQIIETRASYRRAWYRSPLLKSILANRRKPTPWWRRMFLTQQFGDKA